MSDTHFIDPEITAARQWLSRRVPSYEATQVPLARYRELSTAAALHWSSLGPKVNRTQDFAIEAGYNRLISRLYWPLQNKTSSAILYIHGGGWTVGSIETHDHIARWLSNESRAIVLSIDYRLAPENKFPRPLLDVVSAWRWLLRNSAVLGVDQSRCGVVGDSSGANLALALCVHERDRSEPLPAAGGLICGTYAPDFCTPSQMLFGGGLFGLTTEKMSWFWRQYLIDIGDVPHLAAPLWANLYGVPPLYISLGQLDPLADDSKLLAGKLKQQRSVFVLDEWPGATHGFWLYAPRVALGRLALRRAGLVMRHLLQPLD